MVPGVKLLMLIVALFPPQPAQDPESGLKRFYWSRSTRPHSQAQATPCHCPQWRCRENTGHSQAHEGQGLACVGLRGEYWLELAVKALSLDRLPFFTVFAALHMATHLFGLVSTVVWGPNLLFASQSA